MKPAKLINLLLSLFIMVTLLTSTSQAALKAVGPTSLVSTLPTWYQDATDLALEPCLDQNGFCILTPLFDAAFTTPPNAITVDGPITPTNFPDEMFYFIADALIPNVGIGTIKKPGNPPIKDNVNFRIAMEAAFLGGVSPNTGIVFLRVNLQKISGLTPSSIYTVTHPYGSFQFSTGPDGNSIVTNAGQTFRVEDPVTPTQGVYFPPEMQQAVKTHIGPFLRSSGGLITAPNGHIYIGDPTVPTTVIGSPYNTNFLQIDGPDIGGTGINTVSTNSFNLGGRVFTGPIARPLTIDRSTYARDANGGQLDIFVTTLANATITIAGNGIDSTVMTPDALNPTKYFAHIPFSGPTLPTSVVLTNSLDIGIPLIPHPITLVDEVIITEAIYTPFDQKVLIKAVSRDTTVTLPTLTAVNFADPNILVSGVLGKTITSIPPALFTVTSSKGGSASLPVSVVTLPELPTAVSDSASTNKDTPVTVQVLANDTAAGGIDPTSVTIVSAPASGTAVPDANGTIIYTPALSFTGTDPFTYAFRDTFGQISNAAAVTVTVHAPPLAVNDAATVAVTKTISINVIANDSASGSSLNSATINIVSPVSCGTIAVQANGTVDFTAPATVPVSGSCSFSYVVSDTFIPSATSNAATVTVTIVAPPIVTLDAPLGGSAYDVGTVIQMTATPSLVSGATIFNVEFYDGATLVGYDFTSPYNLLYTPITLGVHGLTAKAYYSNGAVVTSTVASVSIVLPLPSTPSNVNPTGIIATATPTYSWNKVATATSYDLITVANGVTTVTNYLDASICTAGTCSVTSAALANPTDVYWNVRALNPTGSGPYTATTWFRVSVTPVVPTNVNPTGIISTSTPSYSWNKVPSATSYDLITVVNGVTSITNYLDAAICTASTCTVTSAILPTPSDVYWNVRARNSAGLGPYTATTWFRVLVAPTSPVNLNPTGIIATNTPSYTWDKVATATSYTLITVVNGVTNTTSYQDATICSAGTCTVISAPLPSGANVYWNVRAANSGGAGSYSPTTWFRVP